MRTQLIPSSAFPPCSLRFSPAAVQAIQSAAASSVFQIEVYQKEVAKRPVGCVLVGEIHIHALSVQRNSWKDLQDAFLRRATEGIDIQHLFPANVLRGALDLIAKGEPPSVAYDGDDQEFQHPIKRWDDPALKSWIRERRGEPITYNLEYGHRPDLHQHIAFCAFFTFFTFAPAFAILKAIMPEEELWPVYLPEIMRGLLVVGGVAVAGALFESCIPKTVPLNVQRFIDPIMSGAFGFRRNATMAWNLNRILTQQRSFDKRPLLVRMGMAHVDHVGFLLEQKYGFTRVALPTH